MEEKRKKMLESGKTPLLVPSSFLTEEKYEHDPENTKSKPYVLGISFFFFFFLIGCYPSYGNVHLILVLRQIYCYLSLTPPPPSQEMDEFQNQLHSTPQQHILVVMPTRHCLNRQYWTRPIFFMVLRKSNEMMENFAKVSTSRLYKINLQHIFFFSVRTNFPLWRDEETKPNKNPWTNYYKIGLTGEEFGRETKAAAGKKPQHCL